MRAVAPPDRTAPVLVIAHVPWEGPHRVADALARAGIPVIIRMPLAGEPLPSPARLAGAVIMGGPMNVDDTVAHPELRREREWTEGALDLDLPLLGICLGSQMIARALGAAVVPGPAPEIGWAPVRVHDPDDPVVGPLAPATPVLHWHGDVFDPPPGATALAASDRTACQAYRAGNAWGLLFHPESDAALVERWLAEPVMVAELREAAGSDAVDALRRDTATHETLLVERSTRGLDAWAAVAAARRAELTG